MLTAKLHDAGLYHQDFHPGNVMVRLSADHSPELCMIDLDALRTSRRMTWKLARQNLASLITTFGCVAAAPTAIAF